MLPPVGMAEYKHSLHRSTGHTVSCRNEIGNRQTGTTAQCTVFTLEVYAKAFETTHRRMSECIPLNMTSICPPLFTTATKQKKGMAFPSLRLNECVDWITRFEYVALECCILYLDGNGKTTREKSVQNPPPENERICSAKHNLGRRRNKRRE